MVAGLFDGDGLGHLRQTPANQTVFVPPLPPDHNLRTANNTGVIASEMEELVSVVRASLAVSEDMRAHAKAATDAANRSSKNALIIAWVSGVATVASLIVAIVALVIAST